MSINAICPPRWSTYRGKNPTISPVYLIVPAALPQFKDFINFPNVGKANSGSIKPLPRAIFGLIKRSFCNGFDAIRERDAALLSLSHL
ncbi:hypothetical protein KCP74_12680 [Salmonella enterica subsp. enterica]|nr:hypothetical protein KCP74_12680 [Salmonella enterica subsp. enterica]